jgi:hypothetical protein
MSKSLRRLVAVLLIPCLAGDPVLASAVGIPLTLHGRIRGIVPSDFTNQAVTAPALHQVEPVDENEKPALMQAEDSARLAESAAVPSEADDPPVDGWDMGKGGADYSEAWKQSLDAASEERFGHPFRGSVAYAAEPPREGARQVHDLRLSARELLRLFPPLPADVTVRIDLNRVDVCKVLVEDSEKTLLFHFELLTDDRDKMLKEPPPVYVGAGGVDHIALRAHQAEQPEPAAIPYYDEWMSRYLSPWLAEGSFRRMVIFDVGNYEKLQRHGWKITDRGVEKPIPLTSPKDSSGGWEAQHSLAIIGLIAARLAVAAMPADGLHLDFAAMFHTAWPVMAFLLPLISIEWNRRSMKRQRYTPQELKAQAAEDIRESFRPANPLLVAGYESLSERPSKEVVQRLRGEVYKVTFQMFIEAVGSDEWQVMAPLFAMSYFGALQFAFKELNLDRQYFLDDMAIREKVRTRHGTGNYPAIGPVKSDGYRKINQDPHLVTFRTAHMARLFVEMNSVSAKRPDLSLGELIRICLPSEFYPPRSKFLASDIKTITKAIALCEERIYMSRDEFLSSIRFARFILQAWSTQKRHMNDAELLSLLPESSAPYRARFQSLLDRIRGLLLHGLKGERRSVAPSRRSACKASA